MFISQDELITDILLWTLIQYVPGLANQQEHLTNSVCVDSECSTKHLLGVMDDLDGWRERI